MSQPAKGIIFAPCDRCHAYNGVCIGVRLYCRRARIDYSKNRCRFIAFSTIYAQALGTEIAYRGNFRTNDTKTYLKPATRQYERIYRLNRLILRLLSNNPPARRERSAFVVYTRPAAGKVPDGTRSYVPMFSTSNPHIMCIVIFTSGRTRAPVYTGLHPRSSLLCPKCY